MTTLLERVHHLFYAVAIVLSVGIVAYFFAPRHEPTLPAPVAVATPGSAAQEFEAGLQAGEAVAASHGTAPIVEKPAVTVVHDVIGGHFSDAAIAQWIKAVGTTKTAPAYHVSVSNPTPAPRPANAPQWHFDDTYAAVTKALNQQTVNVHVTQDPVPPSRTQTLYLSDGTAGIAYAVKRRGNADLDLGFTTGGNHTDLTAGVALRPKGVQGGVYVGPTWDFAQHKAGIAVGLTIAF